MYRGEAPQLSSVQSSSMKSRKPSSSLVTTGRQSKENTETSFDGEGVKVEVESVAQVEDTTDATRKVFDAVQREPESAIQLLKIAVEESRFVEDPFFLNKLKDQRDLERGFALPQNLNLVLGNGLYNIRSVQGQVSFAHGFFAKRASWTE